MKGTCWKGILRRKIYLQSRLVHLTRHPAGRPWHIHNSLFLEGMRSHKYEVIGALNHFHHNCHMASPITLPLKPSSIKGRGNTTKRSQTHQSYWKGAQDSNKDFCIKTVIRKQVSGYQNTIVKGRQISDVVLIANEVLNGKQKSGQLGLLLKLNIEKAFNKLNWSYLFTKDGISE